ncbi:mitotic checkpoint regulator, MAD2B-interacting domain-containing protein [Trichoderma breve]|uniref:Mitotic checkpoint regulator, MAD2B-interacting domain-containing protein n=1 Tax=Trichoderma breve TaxID=2034170 RepID=A0A9W9B6C7_9HYPO|nr:mitotic checkpoint regulator, MAD2B-interacting domain-containing protein [Trichoderma breve]KAJ4857367.1 mitotic checkpoint regulator, MAD2B-interacting domain-containing protein [Trichoderma breve]
MGLVDYSESESEPEVDAPKPTVKPAPKKPAFQKVVDRSNPGKIIVNLPQAASSNDEGASNGDGPPAKRARTGASGGLFSGFNSFLPPPKNAAKATLSKPSSSQARPMINLKTSAEKGFSRDEEFSNSSSNADAAPGGLSLPPPKRSAEPSIPDTMKPAEEVKLKKPIKSTAVQAPAASTSKSVASTQAATSTISTAPEPVAAPAPPPKKTSLFSLHVEEPSAPASASAERGAYEPLFETEDSANPYSVNGPDVYSQQMNSGQMATTAADTRTESLDSIANDLNLSAAARRELFGRGGQGQTAQKLINFNMDQEYQHNEELRAAGEQQTHNPVRAIASGKHSLQQLVRNVSNQREALEESFAKGRSNRKEASSRYGW